MSASMLCRARTPRNKKNIIQIKRWTFYFVCFGILIHIFQLFLDITSNPWFKTLFRTIKKKKQREQISFLNNFLKLTRRMWVKCIIEKFCASKMRVIRMEIILKWEICVRNTKGSWLKSTIYEENRNQVLFASAPTTKPRVERVFFFLVSRYFHLVTPTMLTGFC